MGLWKSIKKAVKKVAKVALPVVATTGLGYLAGNALGLFGSSSEAGSAAANAATNSAKSVADSASSLDWAKFGLAGVNSAASLYQASRSEDIAQQNLQQQMAWNEYAAQHAHQWEMSDLKNAGLNPILTATGGNGASVHSITPQMPDLTGYGNAVSNAFNVLSSFNQLEQQLATIDNIRTQNSLIGAQVDETISKTLLNYIHGDLAELQGSHTAKDMERIDEIIRQLQLTNAREGTYKSGYAMSELFGKGFIGNLVTGGAVGVDTLRTWLNRIYKALPYLYNAFPTKGRYVP